MKLHGIVAAPFLPMLPDHSIDWASLRSYIDWIASQQPSAIAMNMDASEGPSLERDEHVGHLDDRDVAAAAIDRVAPGVIEPARKFTKSDYPPPDEAILTAIVITMVALLGDERD